MLQVLRSSLIRKKFINVIFKEDSHFHGRVCYSSQARLKEEDAEEVRIPVPWGHIAGKYWGSKDKKTFLTVHGWQDNAGSFDLLIPFLSNEYSYLAIDLPGHGLSSFYPKGAFYSTYDNLANFRRIQKHFAWPKLYILGHSLGSLLEFLFSTVFPDLVDTYVGIDFMKPYSIDVKTNLSEARDKITRILYYDTLQQEKASWYKEEEFIGKLKDALKTEREDVCKILMKRGAIEKDGKFKPTRDPRVKALQPFGLTQRENLQLANRIKCNVLIVKSNESGYGEPPRNFHEVFEVVKKNAKRAEFHLTTGTHHLHMENPEIVASIINKFLADIKSTI